MNVAAWCREHDVSDKQMYYWIRKLVEGHEQPQQQNSFTSWMPVQLDSPMINNVNDVAFFIYLDSIFVEVRPRASMTVVSSVLSLLQKPC